MDEKVFIVSIVTVIGVALVLSFLVSDSDIENITKQGIKQEKQDFFFTLRGDDGSGQLINNHNISKIEEIELYLGSSCAGSSIDMAIFDDRNDRLTKDRDTEDNAGHEDNPNYNIWVEEIPTDFSEGWYTFDIGGEIIKEDRPFYFAVFSRDGNCGIGYTTSDEGPGRMISLGRDLEQGSLPDSWVYVYGIREKQGKDLTYKVGE